MEWLSGDPRITNAAGTCKDQDTLEQLLRLKCLQEVGLGTFPSFTSGGNPPPNLYVSPEGTSINRMAVPGPGLIDAPETVAGLIGNAKGARKNVRVSVLLTEFELGDRSFELRISRLFEWGADIVEFDISCGNIYRHGKYQDPIAYAPGLLDEALARVAKVPGVAPRTIALKLPPMPEIQRLDALCEVILRHETVGRVIGINAYPHTLLFDRHGKRVMGTGNGLGSMGGAALRPIALGMTSLLRERLPAMDIDTAGGIRTGRHVLDALRAGANGVEVCTIIRERGVQELSRLRREYRRITNH